MFQSDGRSRQGKNIYINVGLYGALYKEPSRTWF